MREKSSSVLTSFSSRSALRCATSSCSRVAAGDVALRERVLERAEHQRQRRAELVADVARRRRSWPGRARPAPRRAGAPPRRRARWRWRSRSAPVSELEEAAIAVVEPQPRADAGDQQAGGLMRRVRRDRHDDGGVRRVRPRARRHRAEAAGEVLDDLQTLRVRALRRAAKPSAASSRSIDGRARGAARRSMPAAPARRACLPSGVDQVQQRERNVLGVLAQRLRRRSRRPPPRVFASPARAPRSRSGDDPPLADDLLGDLVHRREHAADAARRGLVGHGAVGDR